MRALLALLGLALPGAGCSSESSAPYPRQVEVAGYVDDARCATCHPGEAERWQGSHHDLAMQVATPATVLGDFDDAEFDDGRIRVRFRREGERYVFRTAGPDGAEADFEVAYTFGVEPLQQYLVAFPGGRLQSLTVAWDTAARRWLSLYPDDDHPPGDPLHWTGRYQNWNAMCADCHSTRLEKRYDPETDAYRTTWAALDVGCQACHGPGAAHVRWAAEAAAGAGDGNVGLVTDLRRGAPVAELRACAPCHSRRVRLTEEVPPTGSLLDHFLPERLHAGAYHPDGQVDGEVYVYGSFVQSKMHARGVACSDCHDPHSLELLQPGNALCAQCHSPHAPLDRFPTLQAKAYDAPEHHFHPAGSTGSRCVACHMPAKTFMVVDPRRDHSFRVPRPDLAVELGTPDACSGCHTDRDASWAAERVREWYGPRSVAPDFARALARGREDPVAAAADLGRVAADGELPALVRATALDLLADAGPAALAAKRAALDDPSPHVRAAALRGLENLPGPERLELVLPRVDDPVRAVRVEAGRVLAAAPREAVPPERRAAVDAAVEEFLAAQRFSADQPWAHLNVAILATEQGDVERALASYARALELDPAFLPARFNLATLQTTLGRAAAAVETLRDGLAWAPDEGQLHYSLGLALAEAGRLDAAADALGRAAALLPREARVHYNAGLAHQHLGRRAAAVAFLDAAYRLDPTDPSIVHALAVLHVQDEDWNRARHFAGELLRLAPDDPAARGLLERIDAAGSGGAVR